MTRPAIPFTGNPLDRESLKRRDRAWLEAQLGSEDARFLPFWKLQPLLKLGDRRELAWARRELFEQELGVEGIRVVVVDAGSLVERHMCQVSVVVVMVDDHHPLVTEVALHLQGGRRFARTGAARDANKNGTLHDSSDT